MEIYNLQNIVSESRTQCTNEVIRGMCVAVPYMVKDVHNTTCDTISCYIVSFGALVSTLAYNPLPRQHKYVAHISHLL